MFFKCIAVILILVFTEAKIKLNIVPASNKNNVVITFSGEDYKLVTEKEINLFNITNDNLNRGVRVELGKVPDDIFLKDPTPYDDLFKIYKWPQVKRKLAIRNTEVIDIVKENIILGMHKIINNTTDVIYSDVKLNETVEHTVSSTWCKEGIPDDDVFYDINIQFTNKNFSYQNKWRNHTLRSIFLPFGKSNEGYIELKSGETVIFKLIAKKIIMLIEIEYVASLIGNIVTNFAHVYGKYHFYAPTIGNIMRATEISNEIKTTELINIICYVDPKLEVFDNFTGETLKAITPPKPFRRLKNRKVMSRRKNKHLDDVNSK